MKVHVIADTFSEEGSFEYTEDLSLEECLKRGIAPDQATVDAYLKQRDRNESFAALNLDTE